MVSGPRAVHRPTLQADRATTTTFYSSASMVRAFWRPAGANVVLGVTSKEGLYLVNPSTCINAVGGAQNVEMPGRGLLWYVLPYKS